MVKSTAYGIYPLEDLSDDADRSFQLQAFAHHLCLTSVVPSQQGSFDVTVEGNVHDVNNWLDELGSDVDSQTEELR